MFSPVKHKHYKVILDFFFIIILFYLPDVFSFYQK